MIPAALPPPVVSILYFDDDLGRALDGEFDGLDMEFIELLEQQIPVRTSSA